MKVFFTKLPNGDWICYDRFNEGGDRFVDPAKIQILVDAFKGIGGSVWANNRDGDDITLFQWVDHELEGFGKIYHNVYINIINGVIKGCNIRAGHEGEEIAEFETRFALELNELPAFDLYTYTDVGAPDDDQA